MLRDPDVLIDTALADHRRRVAAVDSAPTEARRYRRRPHLRIGRLED